MEYDESRQQVLLSAGGSELVVVDVADPQIPTLVDSFGEPDNNMGTWSVGADGESIFL